MAKEDEGCTGWQFFNPKCHADDVLDGIVDGTIGQLASAVMEGHGKVMAAFGSFWVNIGTPDVTSGSNGTPISAGDRPEGVGGLDTFMDWVFWVCLALIGISMIILGMHIATRLRRGEAGLLLDKVTVIAGGALLVGAGGAVASAVMPSGSVLATGAGGTTLFLQSATWWIVGLMALVSILVGGTQMAWQQRAEPGKKVIENLVTLIVIAGAGATAIGTVTTAADAYSVWVINASLDCSVEEGSCFGENVTALMALTAGPAGGLGAIIIVVMGLLAILAGVVQMGLMVVRSAMLVVAAGILPLAASFTNLEAGKQWFKKLLGWLIAFILYKPAAATVYAAAFHLTGTDVFQDDGSGLYSVITGLLLMALAIFALPALMKFCTPVVGALASGAAGGAAVAAASALPSGAGALGQLFGGGGSGSGSDGGSGPSGADGSAGKSTRGSSGGEGDSGPSGSGQSGAPGQAGSKGAGSSGASGAAGSGAAGAGASSGAAGAAAGAGGGAAAGAGGGAAAGASAGAAAGPVGAGVGAAAGVVGGAIQSGATAAQGAAESATGEGAGPDGSK